MRWEDSDCLMLILIRICKLLKVVISVFLNNEEMWNEWKFVVNIIKIVLFWLYFVW